MTDLAPQEADSRADRATKARRQRELDALDSELAPFNAEIEQALLGALLRANASFDAVAEFLEPEHFFVPEHQAIYRMIKSKIEQGGTATPETLSHLVEKDEDCREAGGVGYLFELSAQIITLVNAGEYGKVIHDLSVRRKLIGLATTLKQAAYEEDADLDGSAQSLIERVHGQLIDLDSDAAQGGETGKIVTLAEAMDDQIKAYEAIYKDPTAAPGLPCGLNALDAMLGGGFQPGRLYIVAGRPGMGKSTMMQRIIRGIAERTGSWAFIFNLEMTANEMAERELAAQAAINTRLAGQGKVAQADFDRMADALDRSRSLPILIDDRPSQTPAGMDRVVRREKRRKAIGAVAVDYLQICTPETVSRRYGNKVYEVSDMTRAFKQMAKRHQVPVILLSQLSRQVENREDKRPQLSDLRDSGSIEQDADVVLFPFRPEYYLEKELPEQRPNETMEKFAERRLAHEQMLNDSRNLLEVGIAKQRGGPTGKIELYCDLSTMTIEDQDRAPALEGGLL